MATFKDPERQFGPVEVVERLLEFCEQGGYRQIVYLASDQDLVLYLDALGFDVYSLCNGHSNPFDFSQPTVNMLPSGDKGHCSETAH